MCLAIPGQIKTWIDRDPLFARATVEFGGVCREVHMACVTQAEVGDYVIVHAGIAICAVDANEAARTLQEWSHLEEHLTDENPAP